MSRQSNKLDIDNDKAAQTAQEAKTAFMLHALNFFLLSTVGENPHLNFIDSGMTRSHLNGLVFLGVGVGGGRGKPLHNVVADHIL